MCIHIYMDCIYTHKVNRLCIFTPMIKQVWYNINIDNNNCTINNIESKCTEILSLWGWRDSTASRKFNLHAAQMDSTPAPHILPQDRTNVCPGVIPSTKK